MTVRTLPLLVLASAALAAPPLSIPIPRPTPEQEARMVAEEEAAEALRLAQADAAESPAFTDPAVGEESPPTGIAEPLPDAGSVLPAPPPPPPPPPPIAPDDTAEDPEEPDVPEAPEAASPPRRVRDPSVFRRDPFWPVAVARQRKAEHDARIAALVEAEKRDAAIRKARQDAIKSGQDVSELDDDELVKLGGGTPATTGPTSSAKFGGATDEEWDAALAKLPPRSGYLGGKRPALMLKGDKTPHYAGEKLCVTNRNVVFTWRIATVDFRSYTHELRRLKAVPVQGD